MKLKLRIGDSVENLPSMRLYDYWVNINEDLFPLSLGEQKRRMKRVIRIYCNNDAEVLEVASVFPAVLEAVSECIKERIIRPEDVELSVFREEDSQGHFIDSYNFTEDGDLDGNYKLIDLINWLLH